MAWNPFRKSAPEGPTLVMRPVDATVVDATVVEAPAPSVAPPSENVRLAFEAAQREVQDAEPDVAPMVEPEPEPVTTASEPAPTLAAPTPLRFGGATRFGGPSVESGVVDPSPAPSASLVEQPTAVLPVDEPTEVLAVPSRTAALAPTDDAVTAEQASLERERAARREARMAALEPVREDDPLAPVAAPVLPTKPIKHVTDRFFGSLGLFALRLATAAILFVHGLNGIINAKPVVDLWSNTVLPYPQYIAPGVAIAEVALAILLVFGLLTRLAGLGLLAIMAVTLAFVMWGPWSVFEPGGMGFIGEHELLLGAVGLLFLFVGAGGWSVDYMVRRNRLREGMQN